MNRATLITLLLAAAPAATAWVPCEDKALKPPVPLQREAPAYPDAVRATGVQGTVEIALTVLRDGSVGWVSIARAEPRGYFEQAASEGVRRWRFAPALRDGEPVECRMRTRVRFTLTDTIAGDAGAPGDGGPQPAYPPALLHDRIEGYVDDRMLDDRREWQSNSDDGLSTTLKDIIDITHEHNAEKLIVE